MRSRVPAVSRCLARRGTSAAVSLPLRSAVASRHGGRAAWRLPTGEFARAASCHPKAGSSPDAGPPPVVPSRSVGSFRALADQERLEETLGRYAPDVLRALQQRGLPESLKGNQPSYLLESQLNLAAFGRPYAEVRHLAAALRTFADAHPDVFYDQALFALLDSDYCLGRVREFFAPRGPTLKGEEDWEYRCTLVPNCTMALKSTVETLIKHGGHRSFAVLEPVYPATRKLLHFFSSEGAAGGASSAVSVHTVGDSSTEFLFEERPEAILAELDKAYAANPFTVLVGDAVASQSGRILPLDHVSDWCREHGVVLVVDASQAAHEYVEAIAEKRCPFPGADYLVTATHKWLGNVRTCAVVRWKVPPSGAGDEAGPVPRSLPALQFPPGVSFGYSTDSQASPATSSENLFQWVGMLDSYVAYASLGLALKLFEQRAPQQLAESSALLEKGMDLLAEGPLLRSQRPRNIQSIAIHHAADRFFPERLSVDEVTGEVKLDRPVSANDLQTLLQDLHGLFVSVKPAANDSFLLRFSVGPETTLDDFQRVHNVLNHNVSIRDLVTSLNVAFPNFETLPEAPPNAYTRAFALRRFKDSLKLAFTNTYDRYTRLFQALEVKANFVRAERLRHHLIFYLGHTAVFFVNKLVSGGFGDKRVDPKLESLFAVGVDEMSWDDILEENYYWCPFLEDEQKLLDFHRDAMEYRAKVRQLVLDTIEGYDLESSAGEGNASQDLWFRENTTAMKQILKDFGGGAGDVDLSKALQPSILWIILMGIEHEKIHMETSGPIIAQLPLSLLKSGTRTLGELPSEVRSLLDVSSGSTERAPRDHSRDDHYFTLHGNPLVEVPGSTGKLALGKTHSDEADFYGWDNEFDEEIAPVPLEPFRVSKTLVSNREFLDFVTAGGYSTENYWTVEGWRFVQDLAVDRPRFWLLPDQAEEGIPGPPGSSSKLHELEEDFLMDKLLFRDQWCVKPMPWDWPVMVNNLEADAFCRWKSEQGPLSVRLMSHQEHWHLRQVAKKATHNVNLKTFLGPSPINHNCGEVMGEEVYDVYGNVWRHSCSVLTLMDGFKPHPAYDDFTLPTIDGFHNHILGGSFVSIGNCANNGARYGFRRHFYQFAGIRYVEAEASPQNESLIHYTVPQIIDAVPLGRRCSEHYCEFFEEQNMLGIPEESFPMGADFKPVSNWPRLLGEVAAAEINKETGRPLRVLVVHGSVGRTTLELLRACTNLTVEHSDPTANSLQVLESLLDSDKIAWHQQDEGTLTDMREFKLSGLASPGQDIDKDVLLTKNKNAVTFTQMNYENLKKDAVSGGEYDVIVADFQAQDAFSQIAKLCGHVTRPGGIVVLATVDDGDEVESFFHRRNLDHKENGEDFVWDQQVYRLTAEASESTCARVPHVWKETRNKHQYMISNLSVWKSTPSSHIEQATNIPKMTDAPGASASQYRQTRSSQVDAGKAGYYDSEPVLESFRKLHFETCLRFDTVPNFLQAMADYCKTLVDEHVLPNSPSRLSALDVGCGPGRSALELCKSGLFSHVEAFDFSAGFVKMLTEEYESAAGREKWGPANGTCDIVAYQGDTHDVKEIVKKADKQFDLVLASNVIDRLNDPEKFVLQARELAAPGGIVVIASPYTWKENHTSMEKWLGGKFTPEMEKIHTQDRLCELMGEEYSLIEVRKIPFIIPDPDGTFQYTFSNVTAFQRSRKLLSYWQSPARAQSSLADRP